MSQVSHIRESPLSPIRKQHATSINENTSVCIEKAQVEQKPTLISPSKYGLGFTIMQKQGYDGYSGLGCHKQGIIEPITI